MKAKACDGYATIITCVTPPYIFLITLACICSILFPCFLALSYILEHFNENDMQLILGDSFEKHMHIMQD